MKKFFGDLISAHKRTFILLELIHPNTAYYIPNLVLRVYRRTHFMPEGTMYSASKIVAYFNYLELEFIDWDLVM